MYDDMHDAMLEQIKNLQMEIERLKSINNRLCDNLNNLPKNDNDKFMELRKLTAINEELVCGIKNLLSLIEE
jgi:FtsZ-binding cell division protein ZapB